MESDTFSIALQPNPKVPWCIGAQRPLQVGLSEIFNISNNSDNFNPRLIVDCNLIHALTPHNMNVTALNKDFSEKKVLVKLTVSLSKYTMVTKGWGYLPKYECLWP